MTMSTRQQEESDFTGWLLQSQIPTIRYLTLRDLMGRPEDDADVQSARKAIMTEGPVPAILAKQTASGQWGNEHSFYTPKYTSSHWSLLLLAELQADAGDAHFKRGVDWMLEITAPQVSERLEKDAHDWECLWANILRYAIHCGYADDPRAKRIATYLATTLENPVCTCPHNHGLSCAWGAARTLWALAALPSEARSPAIEGAIQNALIFLLDSYQLQHANYPTPGKTHPLWFKLNFPLFYQTDILFTLRVLHELGALHHRGARPALDWLAAQRKPNGRWQGSSPYRPRTWKSIGNAEDISRWVSLQAATILDAAA
jgi:hypothetical protein